MTGGLVITKKCTKCGEIKPYEDFTKFAGRKHDIGSWCKLCKNKDTTRHKRENAEQVKQSFSRYYYERGGRQKSYEGKLRRRFGLTPEQFNELAKDGCAVCGTMENLCVDHDHFCCPGETTCGKCIRGVLCSPHNRGEGFFQTIEEIEKLMEYRLKWVSVSGR